MKNIQTNSKTVEEGDIFIAISCKNLKDNIKEAIDRKAGLIFVEEKNKELLYDVDAKKIVFIKDARLIASKLAKFKHNAQPNCCVCVTGTNGKSSCVHFLNQIWNLCGEISASFGPLGLFIGGRKIENAGIKSDLTTPDPFILHKILEYLYENNVNNAVFEASSHAIEQKRLHSVDLAAAAFTNISTDHLDYHKTKEEYLKAKASLFLEVLPKENPAVILGDSKLICASVKAIHKNVITFGLDEKNDIKAYNIREYENKIVFDCDIFGRIFKNVTLNLFGRFQALNVLCATGLACSCGAKPEEIIEILPKLKPLDGRMEHIISYNNGEVYVDYAHTSEGFKNALECFKRTCPNKLICIFGCGGDRDKTKRSEMGQIAQDIADIVIVTDDNPRSEDPKSIRKEIINFCPKAIEIDDRKEAIKCGMNMLSDGDFLTITGKGCESIQIYSNKTLKHNDKEEILKIASSH
jgi:UDP-N-acetylmuramoyl-L-alanyl-D-glutamate--2,6-diaminopimelate ligase